MNTPNLFTYATSELSQDAFICWLLEWAQPEHNKTNSELHACGVAIIKEFFIKHGLSIPENFHTIEVEKQHKNIDVLCIVNDKYPIIIEDKTCTGAHSDQLRRYYELISNSGRFVERHIIPIYFKTHDQSNYDKVRQDKYQEFTRSDFLQILGQYTNTGSDIYESFRSYLRDIERRVQSYKNRPDENDWDHNAWSGFFMALQNSLKEGNWKYIPNRKGGFMGFWWHFDTTNGISNHLQLENNKLVFKVTTDCPEEMKSIRKRWYTIIQRLANEMCLPIKKPTRFGSGKSVTVSILKDDYRKFNGDTLDMNATLKTLLLVQKLLDKARSEYINIDGRLPEYNNAQQSKESADQELETS